MSTQAVGRSQLRLLGDPTFGPFFGGKLFSTMGVWIHNIAAAIIVWDLTRSTMLVGAVSVAQFLPQIVLAPYTGGLADRGDRRRQLVAGRIVGFLGSGGLALWSMNNGLTTTVDAYVTILAGLVVGIGFAIGLPAMHALLPALVEPEELPTAIALNSLPMTIARAGGPALGALLLASAGATATFLVAAGANLVYAVILAVIRIREVARRRSADRSMLAGWRHARSDAPMMVLLLGILMTGIGTDPVVTLSPAIADQLGRESSFVGVLASAFGIGSAVGFVTLRRMQVWLGLRRLGVIGMIGMAAGFLLVGISALPTMAQPPLTVVALLVGGLGMAYALTSLTTLMQQRVPDELRGRVMALWGIAFLGSRPLSAAMSGTLADLVSVEVALAVVIVVLLVGARLVHREQRLDEAVSLAASERTD
ncbi:MAG: MFS transporter [Nitriliruptoraceae bacterium]